jgi:hypothetical protein
MVMGPDHGAVDHLELVGRDPRVVQSVQHVLPQPRQGPAAELTVDRRPLAELLREIPPWRASPCSAWPRTGGGSRLTPENPIQNKAMICGFAPVRTSDSLDETLEEDPLIVGYQVACQAHLPRGDELQSQVADQGNPFCQHDLVRQWLLALTGRWRWWLWPDQPRGLAFDGNRAAFGHFALSMGNSYVQ